jgi:hypothetical protein
VLPLSLSDRAQAGGARYGHPSSFSGVTTASCSISSGEAVGSHAMNAATASAGSASRGMLARRSADRG